jgi:hypothetical protein
MPLFYLYIMSDILLSMTEMRCLTYGKNTDPCCINTLFFTITEKKISSKWSMLEISKWLKACAGRSWRGRKVFIEGWKVILVISDGRCSVLPQGARTSLWLRHKICFGRVCNMRSHHGKWMTVRIFFLPWLSTKFYMYMLLIRVIIIESCDFSVAAAFII